MAVLDTETWRDLVGAVQVDRPDLYRAWFVDLPPGTLDRGELEIRVPDSGRAHYLTEACTDAFVNAAIKVSGHLVTVAFRDDSLRDRPVATNRPSGLSVGPLTPDYTFDQFVVGQSNRMAHAACQAVCSQPGTLYNPLFLHGPSGLGKTHLLQAACAELIRRSPGSQAIYITCETFVNDLVMAIGNGALPAFRDSARHADLLVIDDVQFLAGRESSQEEVFHTFNALYQTKRQIILSADSPPTQIPTLEDRLVSRFNWGLVAHLDPPNRETRVAILQKKAVLRGWDVPMDILDIIAERVEGNIRLLEGALNRLFSAVQLDQRPMSIATAEAVASEYSPRPSRPLLVSEILQLVAERFAINPKELQGRKRSRSISLPRMVAMYLARRLTNHSLEDIGLDFGGRDHSTVLHAERTIAELRQRDTRLDEQVTAMTAVLTGRS